MNAGTEDAGRIVVLGSGMAASGAVHRLFTEGITASLYDKSSSFGGHTSSTHHEGRYTFDEGPHISFTTNERLQQLFAANVDGEYEVLQAHINNYWRGHWVKHPAQCNLHGLPPDLVTRILLEFVAAREEPAKDIRNYEDWLVASYGRTFAENFPIPYNLKYHTTPPRNMTTDWLGPRMYRPSLEEALRGALGPTTKVVHYVDHFRYPRYGGFASYVLPFSVCADTHLDHELVRIEPRDRLLRFRNGAVVPYHQVISSIPLPELIPMIDAAPPAVVDASKKLACTSCVVVNVVVERPDVSDAHITYFYDPDIFFSRVSYPSLFSPNNAPPGTSSIQVETYWSNKYRPLDRAPEDCVSPVLADLRRCGILRDDDVLLFTGASVIPYANVIFDLEYPAALATVHAYLDEIGVLYCGRYGDWAHLWTDQAFESGERAAQASLDRTASRP